MKTALEAFVDETPDAGNYKSLAFLARLHRMPQDEAKFIQLVGGVERAELDGPTAAYPPRQFIAARRAVEAGCKALSEVENAPRMTSSQLMESFKLSSVELKKLIYRYDLDETTPHLEDTLKGERTYNKAIFQAALGRQRLLDATLANTPTSNSTPCRPRQTPSIAKMHSRSPIGQPCSTLRLSKNPRW